MVVGQVDLDAVGVLGHGCVELALFEHGPALYPARRRGPQRQSSHRFVPSQRWNVWTTWIARFLRCCSEMAADRSPTSAARSGLSTPAVKRRVDRLEAAGVIRGYAAVVDASRLGLGFEAIAEVYCADRTAPHDVLASVEGIPEVVSAVTVSGEPDAVLRVQVDDIRHLERLIETLRRRPNVVRTRTMIVLSVLVDRPSVAARSDHLRRVRVRLLLVPRRGDDAAPAHALDTGDGVWLVDPVDVPEAIERARRARPRPPACCSCSTATTATARRSRRGSASRTCACRPASPAARSTVVPVLELPRWHEIALWWPERRGARRRRADRHDADPRARRRPRRRAPDAPARARRARCAATSRSTCSSAHGRGVHGPAARRGASRRLLARAHATCRGSVGRLPDDGQGRARRARRADVDRQQRAR